MDLQDLLGRVTPGPWGFDDQGGYPDAFRVISDGHVMLWMDHYHTGHHADNAALIAAAPDLAAEVLRLRAEQSQTLAANAALVAEVARLREALHRIADCDEGDADMNEWGPQSVARAFLAGKAAA